MCAFPLPTHSSPLTKIALITTPLSPTPPPCAAYLQSKNAFSRAVFSRLVELLARAEQSESVLAVALTGAGGYFTSGADVKELQTGRKSSSSGGVLKGGEERGSLVPR